MEEAIQLLTKDNVKMRSNWQGKEKGVTILFI